MGIKGFWTTLFLLTASTCLAQQIQGTVMDTESKMPIVGADISNGKESTLSDTNGNFQLATIKTQDTLWISKSGYHTRYVIAGSKLTPDKLMIYLSQNVVSLKEVLIKAKERYKQDSLRTRKDFSQVFSYKAPGIKDAFIGRSAENRMGGFRDPNSNSTAAIVSVDLLQFAGMLAGRKNPVSKLQKIMLQEEKNKSVDQSFSRSRISALTTLQGDSLLMFMDLFRPSALEIQVMTSYELMLYIKRSYRQFIENKVIPQPLPALRQEKHAAH